MSCTPAAPRRTRLARAGAVAAGALAASAALLVGGEAPVRAATPLTLTAIAIDGAFADWDAVLANALQTTRDGDGSSYTQAQCAQFSTDRDCALSGGSGNDFLTFAWTYDATNVYLYVERYGSPTNGVDLLFVADVNRDKLLTGADRVVRARWSGQTGTVSLEWSPYEPAPGSPGDAIACAPLAPADRCANSAGILAAPAGYVDGYKLPGTNPQVNACAGCTGRGNTTVGHPMKGLQVEVAIPWTTFAVAPEQPFYWHVVSSNDRSLANAVDNIGAPNGTLGSFSYRGVSLFPDGSGSVASPGQVTYHHTLRNDGNDQDVFDLFATSSQGAQLELLDAGIVVATDLTGDGAWDSILAGRDTNADGRPDVSLGSELERALSLRITMPGGRSGLDVTRLAAVSAGDRLVSADVTDTSQIGTASFVAPSQAGATTAGQPLPFQARLRNAQGVPETFALAADAGCGPAPERGAGFRVELAPDVGGAPGAAVAIDDTGDGSWDTVLPAGDGDGDGKPDLGEIAAGGTSTFHLVVTPPAGTAAGVSCTVTLAATGTGATGASASARHDVAVAEALTFGPSYVGASPGVRDASDAQVAVGSSIFLPATIVNAESSARAYDLVTSFTGPAGGSARVWSDPDGDGNPSDGAPIATTPTVLPWGGVAHVVVEVAAGATPGFATARVTAAATAGGATAQQVSEVILGYLAVYADALHVDAASAFAPCDTVHVGARGLVASDVARYALEWAPPSGAAPLGVSPWPTTAIGSAAAELALPADAALGGWRARLLDGIATKDQVGFSVERAGTIATLTTGATRYTAGDAVAVAASISNGGGAALLGSTLLYSGATARTLEGVDVLAGGTLADAFTFTLPEGAALGVHTLTLGWRLSCGAAPFVTGETSFVVAPRPPAIAAPAGGSLLGTPDLVAGRVAVSGTAVPGALVALRIDGTDAGTAVADALGAWSIGAAVSEGPHELAAIQTVSAVASDASAPVPFTLDTTPPAAPGITSPPSGTSTSAASVAVSGGAADPSAVQVQVFAGGVVQDTVPVVAGGFEAAVSLAEGTWDLTARALDAAGNASADSGPVALAVDRTPPAPPTWSAPSPTAATQVPISGAAEPNATVEVLDGAAVVATTTADAAGAFSTTAALTEGTHALSVRVIDAAGNATTSAATSVAVDRTAPAAPSVGSPADGAVLGVADLVAGQVPFSGTTEPGGLVEVEIDGVVVGTAAADGLGAWSLAAAVSGGPHVVRARATDAAGNASGLGTASGFTLDAVLPDAPQLASPGGPLATNAAALPVLGTAEPGATVRLLLDGAVVATAVADGAGAFAADVTLPAGDGPTVLTAIAVDAGGNASAASAAVAVTVDRTAPAAPTLATPPDGAVLAPGAIEVGGSAEPGAVVAVTAAGATVTATAAPDGRWSVSVTFPEGTHTVTARATDAAGNASAPATLTVVARTEGGGEGGGGCGCRTGSGGGAPALLGLAALLALAPGGRRRRA